MTKTLSYSNLIPLKRSNLQLGAG